MGGVLAVAAPTAYSVLMLGIVLGVWNWRLRRLGEGGSIWSEMRASYYENKRYGRL